MYRVPTDRMTPHRASLPIHNQTRSKDGQTWWCRMVEEEPKRCRRRDLNAVASVRDDVAAIDTHRGSGLRGQGVSVEECGGT